MNGRIIFLLEEPSMKILLDGLLPRMFPGWIEGLDFQCVKHEGKSDLDRSIPIKLRAWRIPNDRFVIVRDNDNTNCIDLKSWLKTLCHTYGRPETLVRLVCQELESWYIGDLQALGKAFNDPKLDSSAFRKRFANPDKHQKPSIELQKMIPTFQKGSGARSMAGCLQEKGNLSRSFQVFFSGIRKIADEMNDQLITHDLINGVDQHV